MDVFSGRVMIKIRRRDIHADLIGFAMRKIRLIIIEAFRHFVKDIVVAGATDALLETGPGKVMQFFLLGKT